MANKKQPHNWTKVRPGDIISFKYKSKSTGTSKVHSILVLNPKLLVKLKDGKTVKHLIGIKLEGSNKIELRLNRRQIMLLEKIGEFVQLSEKDNLYRLNINDRFILNDIRGVKKQAYDKIANSLGIQGQYRTYDWQIARKSAVYFEPIRVFTDEY